MPLKSKEDSPEPSSTSSTSEPLSPESERILSSVPSSIGGEADDPGGPADVRVKDDGPVAALMEQVAFETQDVQDMLAEMFDWLAERFQSEHWKLNERQARVLGRPSTLMLNSIWLKLQAYIPEILAKWCEETPGATAFITAVGLVIVPKVTKQVAISRERAKSGSKPKDQRVQPVPAPTPRIVTPVPSAASWPGKEEA